MKPWWTLERFGVLWQPMKNCFAIKSDQECEMWRICIANNFPPPRMPQCYLAACNVIDARNSKNLPPQPHAHRAKVARRVYSMYASVCASSSIFFVCIARATQNLGHSWWNVGKRTIRKSTLRVLETWDINLNPSGAICHERHEFRAGKCWSQEKKERLELKHHKGYEYS